MSARPDLLAQLTSPWARPFLLEGDRRGVLLLHSFTGTPGLMRRLGEALHEAGYTVYCPLLPGHGTTLADMEKTSWQDWLRAARDACHLLLDRCDKVYVGGLSMGGTLTLLLAQEMPLDGIFPIAAPIRIYDRLAPLTPMLGRLLRFRPYALPQPGDPPPHRYDVTYAATPVRKVPDLLRLMRLSQMNLGRIRCPMRIVQPELDRTVVPISAQIIRRGAPESDSDILWLPNSGHVCTLEPEFDRLLDGILDFLARHP
jgi:carboxylesterase